MHLKIYHSTRYEYDAPVKPLPHLAYLRPRDSAGVRVLHFALNTFPHASTVWIDDDLNNLCAKIDFAQTTSILEIATESLVETSDTSPFDIIVRNYAIDLPFSYEPLHANNLAPGRQTDPEVQQAVMEFLWQTLPSAPKNTVQWLLQLAQRFPQRFQYEWRSEEGIRTPQQTLAMGGGSCRDLASLYIACARHMGIAARFASGYHFVPGLSGGGGDMHAWAEVYLPGAGWLGIDPTNGVFCDGTHVPVAHAYVSESVNPLQGAWLGSSQVTSRLSTRVVVSESK